MRRSVRCSFVIALVSGSLLFGLLSPLSSQGHGAQAAAEPSAPLVGPLAGLTSDIAPSVSAESASQGLLGMGNNFSCAITAEGSAKCWGWENSGQLGNGRSSVTGEQKTPAPVLAVGQQSGGTAISGLRSIASGEAHSCAVDAQSAVVCWGNNDDGQLGNNSTTDSAVPVPVMTSSSATLTGVEAVAVGGARSCAVMTNGSLRCWGSLMKPDATMNTEPFAVELVSSGVAGVAIGQAHICTLSTSGGVSCWGLNDKGQLGHGSTDPTAMQSQGTVSGMGSGVATISASNKMNCAVMTTGRVLCWGENDNGQLGRGNFDMVGSGEVEPSAVLSDATTALTSIELTSIIAVSAGGKHACALTDTGTVKCWGWGTEGQLGWNERNTSFLAVDVHTSSEDSSTLSGVIAVQAGTRHTCLLTDAGRIKCSGSNTFGEVGDGTWNRRLAMVDVAGLFASDTTPPHVMISRSGTGTLGAGQTDTITFTLSESSTTFAADDITVTGGTLSSFAGSGTTYTATFTPTPNATGDATININAATFTDAASNDNTASTALTIPFNTAPAPSLLSYSSSSLSLATGTAMAALAPTVTGTVTSWSVSPSLPTGLSLNTSTGVISGTPTTASSARTYTVTATNAAGIATTTLSITVTAPVVGDTMPPVVFLYRNIHILAPGETNTITFAIPEQVTGFTIDDITVTAGTLSNFQSLDRTVFSPQDDVYSVTYTPPASSSGSATMSVAAGKFTDLAGNANLPSLPITLEYNTVPRAPVTDSSGDQTRVSGGAGLVIEDDGEATEIPVVEADSKATLTDGVSTMAITLNERVRLNHGCVQAPAQEMVEVSGSGFEPGTDVEVWVFSEPTLLGTVLVDEDGNFSAELDLPATLPVGDHTVQAEGRISGGGVKALAVGLTIENQNVFVELTPTRVVDTRSGDRVGALDGSGDALEVQITGGDVPEFASAVALNVTVVDGVANDYGGYVTVYPCGTRPDASNLNFTSGQTVPNSVIAPLSDDGTICLYVYGTAHLLVDISGYFESGFEPLTPTRLADTRSSDRIGAIDGSGDALEVQITGDLVPADASAVALNVTVVDGAAGDYGGFVTVYPCGTRPDASNLNFTSGQTVPNSVIAPLSDDGTICLYVYGTAHLLVDISGYMTVGFESMQPERIVDTRSSDRVGAIDGTGDALEVQITGDLVPDTANAVALNVTVVDGAAGDYGGFVTVYPCGTRPDASNLNFTSGQTVPNSVIAPLSDDGAICLYVYGTANLLVDISGYLLRDLNAP